MISEKEAARAARQLLFHRQQIGWMLEQSSANKEALREYVIVHSGSGHAPPGSTSERVVLPGGLIVAVSHSGEVVVERTVSRRGFVQLTIEDLALTRGECNKEDAA